MALIFSKGFEPKKINIRTWIIMKKKMNNDWTREIIEEDVSNCWEMEIDKLIETFSMVICKYFFFFFFC